MDARLLINGRFVGAPSSRPIAAPWDGAHLGDAPFGSWAEMDVAIEAAASAWKVWRDAPRTERQALLRRIAETVRENEAELVETLTHEVGKPVTFSKGEVTRLGLTFDLAAELLDEPAVLSLPTEFDPRGKGYELAVERFSLGPVLAITPYNWPYNLAAHKIAPALAAGNTVVLKPSSLAPFSSLLLARLIHEAGCPAGVLNALPCDSGVAQRAAEDNRVRFVSFTGSPPVGWSLKERLSAKKVSLELGGQAPVVILPDADLEWAVRRTVVGSNGYAGQICIAVQHALVHESVYDSVRSLLIEDTEACPYGNPADPGVVCGPLIDSKNADRVMQWIAEAEAAGATVIAGGNRIGNTVQPTLVENVPSTVSLGCQEVFGPVLTLSRVKDLQEAIDRINSTDYGIHAGVFTRDRGAIDLAYRELEMSGVVINDYPTLRFDNMPYGGVKRSGFGREGVRYTYEEMTEPKARIEKRD
ncbi:MAG: aldehyde dehydrogenase family protein [Armatimonadetes bacterium]|nr:aldehyde dehydrogenase family protein [Armatimonadota bacterium]